MRLRHDYARRRQPKQTTWAWREFRSSVQSPSSFRFLNLLAKAVDLGKSSGKIRGSRLCALCHAGRLFGFAAFLLHSRIHT